MATQNMSARVWDALLKSMVPLSVIISGVIISHEVRLAVIENTRFTERDAAAQEQRILEKLPPEWLRDDLDEIKGMLKAMDGRLRALEMR